MLSRLSMTVGPGGHHTDGLRHHIVPFFITLTTGGSELFRLIHDQDTRTAPNPTKVTREWGETG